MSEEGNDDRLSFDEAVLYVQHHAGGAAFAAMPVFGERNEDEEQRAEGARVFILEADGKGSYRLRFVAGPFFASVHGDEDTLAAADIPERVKELRFMPTRFDTDWLSDQIQILIQKLMGASGRSAPQMPDYESAPTVGAGPDAVFPVSFIGRHESR